jgi:hypothetical protein
MPLDNIPKRYILISCTCEAEATMLSQSSPQIMYSNTNAVFIKVIFLFSVNNSMGIATSNFSFDRNKVPTTGVRHLKSDMAIIINTPTHSS